MEGARVVVFWGGIGGPALPNMSASPSARCLLHDVSLVSVGAAGGARMRARTYAHKHTSTHARRQARTGRPDRSRISSRLSADGSVSCLTWTRGQLVHLFLHPLPQLCRGAASAWRSELLDSLSLSPSLAALILSFCFGETWTRGGTADDDAAAALHRTRTEVRIVGISGCGLERLLILPEQHGDHLDHRSPVQDPAAALTLGGILPRHAARAQIR